MHRELSIFINLIQTRKQSLLKGEKANLKFIKEAILIAEQTVECLQKTDQPRIVYNLVFDHLLISNLYLCFIFPFASFHVSQFIYSLVLFRFNYFIKFFFSAKFHILCVFLVCTYSYYINLVVQENIIMKFTQTSFSPYFVSQRLPTHQQPTIQINPVPRSGSLSSQIQHKTKFKDSSMQRQSNFINSFQKTSSIMIHRPQSSFLQKAEHQYGIQNSSKISLPVTSQDIKNLSSQVEKMKKQILKNSQQIKILKSEKHPQTAKFQNLLKGIEGQYEKRFDVHMTSIMGTIIDIKKQIDSTVQQIRVSQTNRQHYNFNTHETQISKSKTNKTNQNSNIQIKSKDVYEVQQKIRREVEDRIMVYSNRLKASFQNQLQKINSAINLIKLEQRFSIIKTSVKTQKKYAFNAIKLTYKEFLLSEKSQNIQDKKQYDYGYCWTPEKSPRMSTLESSGSQKEREDYFNKSNSKFLLKSSSHSILSNKEEQVQLSQKIMNYFIDDKGYLLDQNNYYLTDQKGCMIQLNGQAREKLKKAGILKV